LIAEHSTKPLRIAAGKTELPPMRPYDSPGINELAKPFYRQEAAKITGGPDDISLLRTGTRKEADGCSRADGRYRFGLGGTRDMHLRGPL
jgi:hypothetical protein